MDAAPLGSGQNEKEGEWWVRERGGADFRSADQFSPDLEYFMEGLVQQAHGRAQKRLIRRGHKHARRAKGHETESKGGGKKN